MQAANITSFLRTVADLKAERFVVRKTGATPEHKLDPESGALAITLWLEGQADPHQLIVGGEHATANKSKYNYASTNQRPGDVFLIPAAALGKAKEQLDYFRASE